MATSTSEPTTRTSADTSPKPERRWPIVVAAVSLQLCLGSVYAWSVFRTPLERGYGWSYEETAAPFRFFLFAYAFGIWIGGSLLDRLGPRAVARMGGLLLTGLALASFQRSPLGLAVCYGLIGGLGAGIAYPTPVATLIRWFPERKGLMGGVGVFGFGAGSLVFAPVIAAVLDGAPHEQAFRLPPTFLTLGVVFAVVGWVAGGAFRWPPEPTSQAEAPAAWGTAPLRTVRTWPYPALWLCFLMASGVGLAAINEASPLLERLGQAQGGWIAPALGVGLMAVANGAGRLLWGFAADRLGRRAAMALMFAVLAGSALLYTVARSQPPAVCALIGIGLCFGGMLGMLPTNVGGFFGTRCFGSNYGMTYTAFALAAWLAPAFVSASVRQGLASGSATAAHAAGGRLLLAAALVGLAAALTLRGGARPTAAEGR